MSAVPFDIKPSFAVCLSSNACSDGGLNDSFTDGGVRDLRENLEDIVANDIRRTLLGNAAVQAAIAAVLAALSDGYIPRVV